MIPIIKLKGKRVSLTKIEDLPNRHSHGEIGRVQIVILTENIIMGYTVMKKRNSRHRDEAPMSVPATSAVSAILEADDKNSIYKIATQSSVYEIKVL